jgi:hypothetical protein
VSNANQDQIIDEASSPCPRADSIGSDPTEAITHDDLPSVETPSDSPTDGLTEVLRSIGATDLEQTTDASTEEIPPPTIVGRYRIVRTLASGGFGRVYLAVDKDLDRQVAIKMPRRADVASIASEDDFLTEARILATLDHPGIVPVYDVGRSAEGHCFIVSKLIEGTDLARSMRQARRSFRDSAELVAAVAYDMLGNMYEWCQDDWNAPRSLNKAIDDDTLTLAETIVEKKPRVLRGGAFGHYHENVRSATRYRLAPSYRDAPFGFRPARTCD